MVLLAHSTSGATDESKTMNRQLLLLALCVSHTTDAFTNQVLRSVRTPCSTPSLPTSTRQYNSLRELDDHNMKDLLFQPTDGKAVLVDVCSTWCGPCKLIEPYIAEAAKKYSEHLSVIKYDVECKNTKSLKVEMLLQGVLVRGLPTLLLYNNGVPVATHSGAITEQDLYGWLDNNLATISETKSGNNNMEVSKKEVEERDAVNEVPTSGKRGFVSFVDRYTL